jgi:hypothetical protein
MTKGKKGPTGSSLNRQSLGKNIDRLIGLESEQGKNCR